MHLTAPEKLIIFLILILSSLLCLEKIIPGFPFIPGIPFILSCNAIAQLLNLALYTHLIITGFISSLIMTVNEYGLSWKLWLPLSFSSPSKLSL